MASSDSTAAAPRSAASAPLLGRWLAPLVFFRDPLRFIARLAAEPGEVVHRRIWGRDIYLLKHPDLIREVLVARQHDFAKGRGLEWAKRFLGEGLLTSEGDQHTRQRRLAQPAFHRQRIASYASVMVEHARRTRERWTDGQALEIDREMTALTLSIAGKTLFDTDTGAEAAAIGAALTDILALFPRFALPFAGLLEWLPLPSNRRFERARKRLDDVVYRMVAERRAQATDRGDLLSMLMLATDEEGDGGGMSDLQLRDEIMTLLLAGHETTANAMTWTWSLLARNPAAESRLHRELDGVLGDRLPTADDLPRLCYTEMVLAESMRLFPPAWGLGRRALRDLVVGGTAIPAGSLVLMSQYLTHRDPRFYPEPERFEPDRFLPEARAARPRLAYFPFGAGARQCIGEGFAWMEGALLLATLAQRWRFDLAPGQRLAPQALITLRPRHGMRMVARRRPTPSSESR